MIGWAYVVMTLIVLFGMRSISFVRRFGKRNAGILLFGMAGISCSILAITTNSIISVLSILCIRIAFTMITPLSQTIQHNLVSHKNRATAISVNAVIMDGVAVATVNLVCKVQVTISNISVNKDTIPLNSLRFMFL